MKLYSIFSFKRRNWSRIQCVRSTPDFLGTWEPTRGYVMLDDEDCNGPLESGDSAALSAAQRRVGNFIARVRRSHGKAATYCWPYPRAWAHVAPFAVAFKPLLTRVDAIGACCYFATPPEMPSDVLDRGRMFDTCLRQMGSKVSSKPRIGVISDMTNDGTGMCTDDMLVTQIQAAVFAGCTSILLWSGVEYRYWCLRLPLFASTPDTVVNNVSRARAELLGTWGWDLHDESDEALEKEYDTCCRRMMTRVEEAMGDTA